MELHERQCFDFLLQMATERYSERIEQRNEGAALALSRLRANPEGEGLWLSQFVKAFFDDFLLNNPGGACFVLKSLAKRQPPALSGPHRTVEDLLVTTARAVFAELLLLRTEETLERACAFATSGAE